ncbi:MucR family transcriptional regulator [Sphingomonas sp. AR_OL41]|uniref:MucR family transcriptional regulator n=1 Tax=Sphingomonas sp. AR_OL41 TaxID=3042729 RepID=UPI002480E460|nr:MucR family transcriptional regulator [Sphingomonas sp. AR_OL41]MDH7972363.1 MucR family transcriptional regulator [Sphingomonas sp. AR_OL41]
MTDDTAFNAVELATELTIAWLSNPNTRANADEVPSFLAKMHQAVNELATPSAPAIEEATSEYIPAVSVKKSLASKDHIISMIDGKPYKTLKRHLAGHGLTPAQYRERYNLKVDYPMVSENYSEARRAMAHKIGLGQKGRAARATSATAAKPARVPRKPKTA